MPHRIWMAVYGDHRFASRECGGTKIIKDVNHGRAIFSGENSLELCMNFYKVLGIVSKGFVQVTTTIWKQYEYELGFCADDRFRRIPSAPFDRIPMILTRPHSCSILFQSLFGSIPCC
jgi:hypothetical protein